VTWCNSVPNLNTIEQSAPDLLQFQYHNDIEHVLSVALGFGIIFAKFDLRQRIRAWTIALLCSYVMSRCCLDLWPVELQVRDTSCVTWSKSMKFERNRAIPGWIIDNLWMFAHVISGCELDLWPLHLELLQHFKCPVLKLCTAWKRIIYGWVIDDSAHFRMQFQGVGRNWQSFLRGAWTQLHQTWPGHRAIITALHSCFRITIVCCVFKRGRLEVEWCCKGRQILHFLWKLGEG